MDTKLFDKSAKLFCQTVIYRIVKPSLEITAKEELTEVQLSCLRYAAHHSDPSVGEIAEGLAISNAASAKLIDRLVRKKLLTREEDSNDRRVLKINLTVHGKDLLEKVIHVEEQQIAEILGQMSTAEIEALQIGLTGFLKAALAQPEQIDVVCLRCGWNHLINCPGNIRFRELTGEDKKKV